MVGRPKGIPWTQWIVTMTSLRKSMIAFTLSEFSKWPYFFDNFTNCPDDTFNTQNFTTFHEKKGYLDHFCQLIVESQHCNQILWNKINIHNTQFTHVGEHEWLIVKSE